jgi:uncharacterized ion transporter superfamily protein YfcC
MSQSLLNLPMPSDSGKAMLALPILGPLSDLLHISRQVVVLSYQYCTFIGFINSTYGAFLAMLSLAGVSYNEWIRFMLPGTLVLFGTSVSAIVIAIWIGLR